MPEEYNVVIGSCTISQNRITMHVTPKGNVNTPVHKIIGRLGNQKSWERETADPDDRYADIYFNTRQFKQLRENVNKAGAKVRIGYMAPSIPGDDLITAPSVSV